MPASTAAPGLQAQQKEVSRFRRGAEIKYHMSQNLALTSRRQQLEKHMRADSLNEKIAHRPSPDSLLKEGVLHDDPRSPEEKYAEAIEDEYAKREGGA